MSRGANAGPAPGSDFMSAIRMLTRQGIDLFVVADNSSEESLEQTRPGYNIGCLIFAQDIHRRRIIRRLGQCPGSARWPLFRRVFRTFGGGSRSALRLVIQS